MVHDVHNYRRRLELLERFIKHSKTISPANKKAIFGFKKNCFAEGLSLGRVCRYLWDLKTISTKWLKTDFEKAKKEDIMSLVAKIELSQYSPSTKRDFKVTLRKLYRFLRGKESIPEEVDWYSTRLKANDKKLPEELLTEEEVKRMIKTVVNPRNKAFISILYESGCRIGEILMLKLKHIVPVDPGFQLTLDGKTGQRRIRIIASEPYLREWLNSHPKGDDPEAWFWLSKTEETIGYRTATKMLNYAKKKAGIKKRVYPHLFRHSRATHLANHLTEAQMKQYFGWVQASKMAGIYVHLSGRDVDEAILRVNGIIQPEKEKQSELKPKNCPRCKEVNPSTYRFCSRCGMPLDEESVAEMVKDNLERRKADEILDELIKDEEFKKMLFKKMSGVVKKQSRELAMLGKNS